MRELRIQPVIQSFAGFVPKGLSGVFPDITLHPTFWNPVTVKAFLNRVPDNEVLILYYANNYNNNWEPMNAFNGRQWVYGFVPNMGGKTPYTEDLSLYTTGEAIPWL